MNPETPVLMIALQIPLHADVQVDQILEAIGQKLNEALRAVRENPPPTVADMEDPEAIPQEEFAASVIREALEEFTEETRPDLLAALGYASEDPGR